MNMRTAIAVAVVAFLCCAFRPVAAAQLSTGIVVMTTTGGANSITLDVSIADNGEVPGCTYFIITRNGEIAGIYPRQVGAQNTFQFIDTNAVPGYIYWYELVASSIPIPFPSPTCDEAQFRFAFGSGWGAPFTIPGHVGEDPVVLAHGTMVSDDYFWPYVHLESCDSGAGWYFEFGGLPAGFEQYIGQDVLMYGDYGSWWSQNGWIPTITSFEPLPCIPIATRPATWGHVKSMYR